MCRPLHWCLKIGNREASIKFYRDLLGLTILRHEEFDEGCKATCNGPYDNKWSKTMVGYGPEENNFTLELTHNYPIDSYKIGNDLREIAIHSTNSLKRIANYLNVAQVSSIDLKDPDGYRITILEGDDKFSKVSINVSNLTKSVEYWSQFLKLPLYHQDNNKALLGNPGRHCQLELVEIQSPIDHCKGWGRIAFGVPYQKLIETVNLVKDNNFKILHDLVEFGTPGKASVSVIILLDPDDYEICFVGDENYRILCNVDPKANNLLEESLSKRKKNGLNK